MRKSGQKPAPKKLGGGTQGFQGFKITSTPAVAKPSALADFNTAPDDETQVDSHGRKLGICMSLTGTHGETIHSEQEIKDSQKLVIPVKRNLERWKPKHAEQQQQQQQQKEEKDKKGQSQTLREQAIRCLINGDDDHMGADQTKSVIEVAEGDEEAEDVDQGTYERVPVEMFGAAMLRGMGWKEQTGIKGGGKGDGDIGVTKPRPNLLGLGARARPIDDEEDYNDGYRCKIKKF
ncbi:DNA primase large subunit Spp2 [Coemansia sp. RSA 1722]|nr:DNA primase large subunit Spp2 [Coemansia sp. RSA 485]KAJ2605739.1 DNA primase large subunit Spp2 [Coemansia sp. RSA 1722]